MKRVLISKLTPGMVTAEDVFSYNNQLIVAKNTPLTDKIITRLEYYSIMSIRIDDSQPIASPQSDSASMPLEPAAQTANTSQAAPVSQQPQSYSEQIRSSEQFKKFKTNFEASIEDLKGNINDIVKNGSPIDVHSSLAQTSKVFEASSGSYGFFGMLHNMREYDDLTYTHMMNVALISKVLAEWLHFSDEDVEMATLCGLFHDIGKLAIPDNIIKKPDKLTDEEYKVIKTHTVEGYNILLKQDVSDHIKYSALMHHERCDGGGYPLGISGSKIDKFAKIVAIADVYDAMTAARVYRGPLCPFTVIEIFEKEGLQRYEAEYILCFLENVVMTYMNNKVRLSNGKLGEIKFVNKHLLSKPMVLIDGESSFCDLSKEKDISIVEIL